MKNYFTLSWINTYVFLGIYVWYAVVMFSGDIVTNIATWLIFSVSSWINATSYHFATGRDLNTSRIYFGSATMCAVITLTSFFTGQFSSIGTVEKITLGASAFTITAWILANKFQKRGAVIAQLINIFVAAIGFVPLWLAQARGSADEVWEMWALWCVTLLVQCYIVISNWKKEWIEIVAPVSFFWFHVFVVLLDFI